MNPFKVENYPSIGQSVALSLIVIAGMIFLSPVIYLKGIIGTEPTTFLYYLLSMGISLWIIYILWRNRTGQKSISFKMGATSTIPIILLATLGIQYSLTLPISSLIPMPDSIKEAFNLALGNPRNVFTLTTMVILAPLFEEIIFRGIILNGLLKRYSPAIAIVVSSLLFATVHLNPWQFVSAFILGLFIGWVYYKTQSLTFGIIVHAFNNLVAVLPVILGFWGNDDKVESINEHFGGHTNYIIIIVLASLTTVISIILLNKMFKKGNLHKNMGEHPENL